MVGRGVVCWGYASARTGGMGFAGGSCGIGGRLLGNLDRQMLGYGAVWVIMAIAGRIRPEVGSYDQDAFLAGCLG